MSHTQKTANRQESKPSGKEYKEQKTSQGHGKYSVQKKIGKKYVWYNKAIAPVSGRKSERQTEGNTNCRPSTGP
jgi:hypothetical protein